MLFSLQLCVQGVLALCLYMCVRKEKVQEKLMLSWGFHIHCSSGCQEQRILQFSLPIHRRQKKRNRQTKLQISNATQDHNNNSRLTTPWMSLWPLFIPSNFTIQKYHVVRAQTPKTETSSLVDKKVTHQSFKHTNRKLSKQTHHQWLAREIACFKWKFSGTHLHQDKAKERKAWDSDAAATKTGWYQQQQQQHNPIHKNKQHLKYKSKEQMESNLYTKNNNSYTPTKPTMQTNPMQKYPRLNFDIETLTSFCSLKNLLCFFFLKFIRLKICFPQNLNSF